MMADIVYHSQIIRDTMTAGLDLALKESVLPTFAQKYGDKLLSLQLYEDYLADEFAQNGIFYYPITAVLTDSAVREWISWSIEDKSLFENGCPFSYVGEEPLEITCFSDVSEEFEQKLFGRDIYYPYGYAKLVIQSATTDKTFLSGKYSQTFVDELTRQITNEINRTFSVKATESSGFEILMVFAPGTYMEHVIGNVTYRRLLVGARGCSPRDLWIKWSRVGGGAPLTVSDHASSGQVVFALAEDVPQKVREKEYRFIARTSAEKYQAAMTRKNITEWRDLIKRVIKRGELEEVAVEAYEYNAEDDKRNEQIAEDLRVAIGHQIPAVGLEVPEDKPNDDINSLLRAALGQSAPVSENPPAVEEEEQEIDGGNADEKPIEDGVRSLLRDIVGHSTPKIDNLEIPAPVQEAQEEIVYIPDNDEIANEVANEESDESPDDIAELDEAPAQIEDADEEEKDENDKPADQPASYAQIDPTAEYEDIAPAIKSIDPEAYQDELRRRIEDEMRERLEREARERAEEEMKRLREANDALRAENERLAGIARLSEEENLESKAALEEEKEELRRRLEAKELAEEREKQRLAEAARLALLEKARLDEERAEEERQKAEKERIERERLEEERRRAEEQRIQLENAQKNAEQIKMAASSYTYVSKNARLIFNRQIDPNIIKRIHEIILTTIKYFHKEHVFIKIKASVPDTTTVNLHFEKIPEEENELLISIIKVLGKSGLGIVKVYLE